MPGSYTDIQELLPCVLAMKEEGYTYPQIANQFGLAKEQVEELCSRKQRKQRRTEKGCISQPKSRPRKTPATQEQLQIVEYIHFCNYQRIDMKNGLTPFEIRSKAA